LAGIEAGADRVSPSPTPQGWHVLWTRSNCEGLVHDQLAAQGLDVFLPTVTTWSRRGCRRQLERVPLFKGYLFLRHAVSKESYLSICKARGLVRILGERWDQLAVVRETEVKNLRRVLDTGRPVLPHSYLRLGQRVRIERGPFTGVEGVLVRANPRKGLLVVSIELLQRSVAVHLDCTDLVAA
jgi:transcription termination/antitermination protein NusG